MVRKGISQGTSADRWLGLLPHHLPGDAPRLLFVKSLRAFTDGLVSIILPVYLLQMGYGAFKVGAIVTSTLLGSALLTLAMGFYAYRFPSRNILLGACGLMVATGLAFAVSPAFWPLLVVAFFGTINPSAGDVSIFLPVEQTLLAETASAGRRTALFAQYSFFWIRGGGFRYIGCRIAGGRRPANGVQ